MRTGCCHTPEPVCPEALTPPVPHKPAEAPDPSASTEGTANSPRLRLRHQDSEGKSPRSPEPVAVAQGHCQGPAATCPVALPGKLPTAGAYTSPGPVQSRRPGTP